MCGVNKKKGVVPLVEKPNLGISPIKSPILTLPLEYLTLSSNGKILSQAFNAHKVNNILISIIDA